MIRPDEMARKALARDPNNNLIGEKVDFGFGVIATIHGFGDSMFSERSGVWLIFSQDIELMLSEIEDGGLVYANDGGVVYETIIESRYPAININRLCDLFADHLGDWAAIRREYLAEIDTTETDE